MWPWDDGVPDSEGVHGYNRRFGFVWYPAMREIFIEIDIIKTNKREWFSFGFRGALVNKGWTTALLLMLVVMEPVTVTVEGWWRGGNYGVCMGTIYFGQTCKMKMGCFLCMVFFILWFSIQKRMTRWFRLYNETLCVFYIFFLLTIMNEGEMMLLCFLFLFLNEKETL